VIVVDTSVWIAARRQPMVATTLQELLDADEVALALPVRLELLAGLAAHQRAQFKRAMSGIPLIYPSEATWREIVPAIERAADAGERFGLADLLIGSLANQIGALVWSFDKDFERMARLELVSLYSLPH
jgi:predicted nucleic acid-binding protein